MRSIAGSLVRIALVVAGLTIGARDAHAEFPVDVDLADRAVPTGISIISMNGRGAVRIDRLAGEAPVGGSSPNMALLVISSLVLEGMLTHEPPMTQGKEHERKTGRWTTGRLHSFLVAPFRGTLARIAGRWCASRTKLGRKGQP